MFFSDLLYMLKYLHCIHPIITQRCQHATWLPQEGKPICKEVSVASLAQALGSHLIHFLPLRGSPAGLLGCFTPSLFTLQARILGRFAPSGFLLCTRMFGRFILSGFVLHTHILGRFATSRFQLAFSVASILWALCFALAFSVALPSQVLCFAHTF